MARVRDTSHPHYTSLALFHVAHPRVTLTSHPNPFQLSISGIARIQSHAVRPQSPLDNRQEATDYTNGKARMHNNGLLSGSLPYAVSLLNGIVLQVHAPQPKRYSQGQQWDEKSQGALSSSWGSMGIRCYMRINRDVSGVVGPPL